MARREPVIIHPEDAAAGGINRADVVRLWNGRGQVLAGAVLSPGIRPETVFLHEGGWPDPGESGYVSSGR